MRRSGFTLLEMIIVLGVVSVTAGIAVPVYRDYQIKSDLNLATEQVAQGIERARLLSQTSTEDAAWGFYVPEGVLYKGESYFQEGRDDSFDEVYPMPSTIKVHNLYEVAYNKVDGKPSETSKGEIKLTTINDEKRTVSIEVFQESIAVTTPDMITICIDGMPTAVQEHEVPTDPVFPGTDGCSEAEATSSVMASEAAASSEEGSSAEEASSEAASEGAASSEESASEAAASSVASEGAASSAIVVGGGSSAPGGGGGIECGAGKKLICHVPPGNPGNRHTICVGTPSWPAHRAHGDTEGACEVEIDEPMPAPVCADRFILGEDGSITLTGTTDVTVRVLGSEMTFGQGGPNVQMVLDYTVDGRRGRELFQNGLFQDRNVHGGEVAVIEGVPAGSVLALQASGRYNQRDWLRFQNTIRSGDGSGYFSTFRNGAPLPNYPAFNGQQSVVDFLEGYVNIQTGQHVNIGSHAILLLGEMGTGLGGDFSDFQDIVVLLEFGEPTCN